MFAIKVFSKLTQEEIFNLMKQIEWEAKKTLIRLLDLGLYCLPRPTPRNLNHNFCPIYTYDSSKDYLSCNLSKLYLKHSYCAAFLLCPERFAKCELKFSNFIVLILNNMSRNARKPVFRVSDQV